MHQVRLGRADFGDEPGNLAAVAVDVAKRVTHADAAFAHVRPKAVLDVGDAAPHDHEHVKRLRVGARLRRAVSAQGGQQRRRQEKYPPHAAASCSLPRIPPSREYAMVQTTTSAATASIASL